MMLMRELMNLVEKKLLDVPTPSAESLAKKYGVTVARIEREIKKGIKVESEHTSDPKIAREIALDHLGEMLDYYEKLAKAEND